MAPHVLPHKGVDRNYPANGAGTKQLFTELVSKSPFFYTKKMGDKLTTVVGLEKKFSNYRQVIIPTFSSMQH